MSKSIIKYLLIAAGIVLVGIGVVGIFLPGLPTTIFLIAAAACFSRSSPCMHQWLLAHPWFGPIIFHWSETRSIPQKAKVLALCMMLLAAIYSIWSLQSTALIITINGFILISAIIVYRLPSSESVMLKAQNSDSVASPSTKT